MRKSPTYRPGPMSLYQHLDQIERLVYNLVHSSHIPLDLDVLKPAGQAPERSVRRAPPPAPGMPLRAMMDGDP